MSNKIIKQYLKEVTNNIVCDKKIKFFYINEIKQHLMSYASDKPELSLDDLIEEFGSPEVFANQLSDRDEYAVFYKKAKKKAKRWTIIGGVAILLLIIAVIVIFRLIDLYGGAVDVEDIEVISN